MAEHTYTPDQLLALPLESDEHGQIFDRHGEDIADVWQRTLNGAPADEEDDAEAEQLAALRAAEIARRCNAHPEMVSLLRECLQALNQMPNALIGGDRQRTTYGLAARVNSLLEGDELVEALRAVVAIADADPFEEVGHVVEHAMPNSGIRAVLAKVEDR